MSRLSTSSRWLSFACALALLPWTGCSVVEPLHEKTVTLTVGHIPGRPLEITTENGGVEVNQESRQDVIIIANIRATTAERLEQVHISTERDGRDALVIRAEWPNGKRHSREGCRFNVAIPDVSGVDLKSSNGPIQVAGLSGRAKVETSNGAVTVNAHAGSLQVETNNGSVTARDIAGDVDLNSSNGKIEAANVTGAVKIETSNGSVDVELASASRGPLEVKSSNGAVTLKLGQAFAGSLDLKTSNGGIKLAGALEPLVVDRPKKEEARLQFGTDPAKSYVRTNNGAIRVEVMPRG